MPRQPRRCPIPTHLSVGNAAVSLEAAAVGGGGAVPQPRGRAAELHTAAVAQRDEQHRRHHRAHQR